jgi:hypothetical protein
LKQFDPGGSNKIHGMFILPVGVVIYNSNNARIYENFCAVDARKMSHVAGCFFGRDPMQGSLDDGIRFCMDGPDAVTIHYQVSGFVAVWLPCGRAIKPCCQDALVSH